jgi:prepilin-type N-terminal cleavage/methylation domain-containing protein
MLRINKQGFTLIELMVVIVIIGVLASLAIPRFTDASNKAKAAEAPRVLASFESAFLALVAEGNIKKENLVFSAPESKWFNYDVTITDETAVGANATAVVDKPIGAIKTATLATTYDDAIVVPGKTDPVDGFEHTYSGTDGQKLSQYVPNFDAKAGGS